MTAGVYLIINIINNKVYVGSSCNINKRINKHFSLLRQNKHTNSYLQNAWNKYGENNFISYTIHYVKSLNELAYIERYYIDKYNSTNPNKGYNLTLNTNPVSLYADKISKTNKLKNKWSGNNNPIYNTSVEKVLIKKYGLQVAEEKIRIINETNKLKNSGKNNAMYNQPRPDAAINNKIYKSKPVEQYTLDDLLIMTWNSVSEAALNLGLVRRSIANFIHQKNGIACGFKWKYKK